MSIIIQSHHLTALITSTRCNSHTTEGNRKMSRPGIWTFSSTWSWLNAFSVNILSPVNIDDNIIIILLLLSPKDRKSHLFNDDSSVEFTIVESGA